MWCNKMGKVVTKVWKPSVMFTQFLMVSTLNMVFRFLWVFQGNSEEMKHASLAVSTIITVLALVKTALKSACKTLTSWLLRCID